MLLIEGFEYERWPSWNHDDIRKWIDAWTRGVAIFSFAVCLIARFRLTAGNTV